MADDYYRVLGVARNASQAEIQKAYRELARKYHPDLHPDDKNAKHKFQELQTAFDVLNNPEKREMYDRYGSSFETAGQGGPQGAYTWTWAPGAGGAGAGPGGFGAEDFDFGPFVDERFGGGGPGGLGGIFEQLRRSAGSKAKRSGGAAGRSQDIVQEITVPLQVAVQGGEVQIAVQRASGEAETIAVKVPPGIDDGKKIRLRGQGAPGGRRGQAGDLILTIRVAPHPCFHRAGNNLLVRVPVTLAEAALGAKIDVPTPNGTVKLSVPAGTSSGTKLRVKGQGVTPKNGTAGDLLAEVQIVLPKTLNDADRDLLRQIDQRNPLNPRANLRW